MHCLIGPVADKLCLLPILVKFDSNEQQDPFMVKLFGFVRYKKYIHVCFDWR